MNRTLFISGIVLFAIGGLFFMTGYHGIQGLALKFTTFSPDKYQGYQVMETLGGLSAVIGILIALSGMCEKEPRQ